MIVSGVDKEKIASTITRELPFGLWSIDFGSHTLRGYNKFCELMDTDKDQVSFDDMDELVREDYRSIVRLNLQEVLDRGELDITFPTNHKWVRAKLTHMDYDEKMAYGYIVECALGNDKPVNNSHLRNLFDKQSQVLTRMIDRIENNKYGDSTDGILQDSMTYIGANRISVVEYDLVNQMQSCTHEAVQYGLEKRASVLKNVPIDIVPWLNRELSGNEVSYIYDVDSLPKEAEDSLSLLCCSGVRSMAIVPLWHKDLNIGYMLIDFTSKNRAFEESDRSWMKALGSMVEYSLYVSHVENSRHSDKDRLESIIENMPFGFVQLRFVYGDDHKPNDLVIVHANRVFENLVGSEGLVGKTAGRVFGKELRHMMSVCATVAKSGEKKIVDDFLFVNGITISADIFMTGYNEFQCIVSTDMRMLLSANSMRKDPEHRELALDRELQHMIRTNLNAILGFAELMSTETDASNIDKYMEIIKENAKSLLDSTYIKKTISGEEQSSVSSGTSPAPSNATSSTGRKRILIAEDTESNYMLVSYILKNEYDLEWAHDGVEALEMYEANKPDLILMDVRMPRLGGMTATSRIRETDKTTPIIALTAFAFESDKAKTLESGCTDFVSKPINAKTLKDIVKKYI